jgi:uncharacterized membrane protein
MSVQTLRLTRPKSLFYLAVTLGTLFVLYNNERFFLHSRATDPEWIHLRPVGSWIYLHGIPGAIALLTAPLQFSNRLRNRYPALHRTTGYVYFVAVLITAPLGMYVASLLSTNPAFYTISWMHGGSWLICTLIAVKLIRNGDVARHREWMMRSYSWGLIFISARIVLRFVNPTSENTAIAVIWLMMGTAMLWPQLIINWKQIFRNRPSKATEKVRNLGYETSAT